MTSTDDKNDVHVEARRMGDMLADAQWRTCVGVCINPVSHLDGTAAGHCERQFISRERYDENIAPLLRELGALRQEAHAKRVDAILSSVPPTVAPQTSYTPLTRKQIEGYRTLCVADIGILCDMAISSLLYAEEINRLRTAPPSSTAAPEKVKRLLEIMECDDLDEAISQAEFDVQESLAAARFIKKAQGMPENEWPSAHDRRLYLALEAHLLAKLASAPSATLAPNNEAWIYRSGLLAGALNRIVAALSAHPSPDLHPAIDNAREIMAMPLPGAPTDDTTKEPE